MALRIPEEAMTHLESDWQSGFAQPFIRDFHTAKQVLGLIWDLATKVDGDRRIDYSGSELACTVMVVLVDLA